MYVALDVGYLNQGKFAELMAQTEEVSRIIGGLRVSIAKRKQTPNTRP